jgi:N-acetylneuraminic acid mutarotase
MTSKLKQAILILLPAIFLIPVIAKADYWTQKASYPGNGSSRAFCFSIADKGYFGCGDFGGAASDFWQYDTTSNTWTQMASFGGGGRWSGVSFSVNGFGFAGLGWDGMMMSDIWKYDPATNAWTQMNNFPAGQRQVPAAFVIDNKAYIATGRNNGNIFQNDLWEYDPLLDAWTQKSNLPGIPRSQPFGFAIDGLGYIGGGFDQSLNGLNDFYQYDPVADTWIQKASLPAAGRGDPAGFAIGCRGYAGTGQTLPVNNVLNDFWEFDSANNQWTAKSSFGGSARDESSYFVIGEKGYLGLGGVNGASLTNDFWQYSPDTTCIQVIPVAAFNATNHICPGTCTDFTNLSSGATSYLWTFNGANPSVSTDVNPVNICYNTPGNFSVSLIAINSSGSDTVLLNNFMTVYPYPSPQGITQNGDTLIANQGASSYQWYFNGAIISGATDYLYVAAESGDYNVVATDENNCEVEAVIFDVIAATTPLSFGEGSGVRLFPNPVKDKLEIRNLVAGTNLSIVIYNNLGEKILDLKEENVPERLSIDLAFISAGTYFLQLSSGKNIFRSPFVKQ